MFLVVFKGARTLDTRRKGHSGRRGEGHQGREYEGPGGNNDPHPVGGRRRHPTLATRKPRPGEAQRLAWGSEFEPWLPHAPEHGGTAPPGGNEGLPQSALTPAPWPDAGLAPRLSLGRSSPSRPPILPPSPATQGGQARPWPGRGASTTAHGLRRGPQPLPALGPAQGLCPLPGHWRPRPPPATPPTGHAAQPSDHNRSGRRAAACL